MIHYLHVLNSLCSLQRRPARNAEQSLNQFNKVNRIIHIKPVWSNHGLLSYINLASQIRAVGLDHSNSDDEDDSITSA